MLNGIVRFSVRYRGIVVSLSCALLTYGIYSLSHVPYNAFPEFAPAQVSIQTEAHGLSPEQVEVLVTQPIENAINGVSGIESLRSRSIQGLSVITVVFRNGTDGMDALRYSLQEQKDGRLAYRILMDIGAIPSAREAQLNSIRACQPAGEELTPFERAASLDECGRINPVSLAMARSAQETSGADGSSLPRPDEIWRNRTVAALIDEMTGGECLRLSLSDMVEWNLLKGLAEDVLASKRSMTDKEIEKVREKYGSRG